MKGHVKLDARRGAAQQKMRAGRTKRSYPEGRLRMAAGSVIGGCKA
jgi:hypothetical protein